MFEYYAQAFHHSLPKYLKDELEVVQKRELKMISPEMAYREADEYFKLPTLFQRREDKCHKLFTKITEDAMHKLHHLLSEAGYALRSNRRFNMTSYNIRANRFENAFIPAMCRTLVG